MNPTAARASVILQGDSSNPAFIGRQLLRSSTYRVFIVLCSTLAYFRRRTRMRRRALVDLDTSSSTSLVPAVSGEAPVMTLIRNAPGIVQLRNQPGAVKPKGRRSE
jgi:hypothetical protein